MCFAQSVCRVCLSDMTVFCLMLFFVVWGGIFMAMRKVRGAQGAQKTKKNL